MASDGRGDVGDVSGDLSAEPDAKLGRGPAADQGDLISRLDAYHLEEDSPGGGAEGDGSDAEQPSSLTENLSQRVQDQVGAENERGVGDDDPNNYPLHSPWTFWFDSSPRAGTDQDFFANLRRVCTIKTIKAFWCLYNNVTPVEKLQERESYHLMRGEERRPVWEDLNNIDGGFWAFKIPNEATQVVWQELLLAAIGEQFSECMAQDDELCGVSVKIRGRGSVTIQIWHIDSDKHLDARVIQKVKSLIPSIEINEYYQSSKSKMKDHVSKPPMDYRGVSPPHSHFSARYQGPPPFRGPYPPHPHHPHHYPRYPHPGPPPPGPGGYPPPPHFRPPGGRGYHHPRPPYNPTS